MRTTTRHSNPAAEGERAAAAENRARLLLRRHSEITIERVERHRNGMSGAPFHVIAFTFHVDGESTPRPMVGIVFEAADHVAVFDRALLGAGAIAFGGTDDGRNSWRGDSFEEPLRAAIALADPTE